MQVEDCKELGFSSLEFMPIPQRSLELCLAFGPERPYASTCCLAPEINYCELHGNNCILRSKS